MKTEMATRNPTNVTFDRNDCTDFVLHKSQQTIFNGIQKNIIDYTEHRLIRYAKNVQDKQQKLVLMAMIHDYRLGMIAISWKRGVPIYIKVTKNALVKLYTSR